MKKTATLLLLLMNFLSYGQAQLVYDPAANASLIESIENGAMQVEQGLKQLKFLKEASEVLTKINSAVSTLEEIDNIFSVQKALLKESKVYVRELQECDLFTPEEMKIISKSFVGLIQNSTKTIEFTNKLLTSNLFKMNDAERIKFIKEQKKDMENAYFGMKIKYIDYKNMAEQRALEKLFK